MRVPDSHTDDSESEQREHRSTERKPRSAKQFLLVTATRFSIGLGILGLLGVAAWIARNQLVTLTLESFLRSKGVPADITVEKLQLGTAQIRNLRLGPADKPNLIANRTIIDWRVDSKAGLFIIDRVAVDGATLRLAVTQDGKLDFGALASLMAPSTGPKRSIVNGVALSNASLLLDTPQGQAKASLQVSGGEAAGWTGRADVTPPAAMIRTDQGQAFMPLRLGFAARNTGKNTVLGFAARPVGQSFVYNGMTASGLAGDLTGLVTLSSDGTIRVDTRPSTLRLSRFQGGGVDAANIAVGINPVFWTHQNPWQRSGQGNVVLSGTLSAFKLQLPDTNSPAVSLGQSSFRFGAARAQSGRMQGDYFIDGRNVAGLVTGQRVRLSGNIGTTLADLTQLAKADLSGRGEISGQDITLPASLRTGLPPTLAVSASERFSGLGTFDYKTGPKGSQIGLAGPLLVSNASGARVSWASTNGQNPTFVIANKPDGSIDFTAAGTGQFGLALPAFGAMDGKIERFTYNNAGWSLLGRNFNLRPSRAFETRFGIVSGASLATLNLSSTESGGVTGTGSGQVLVRGATNAPTPSRATLAFDGRATSNAMSGTLNGPIEGFGDALGLGGYGVRGGRLSLEGGANRIGNDWQIASRGRLSGGGLTSQVVNLGAPNLSIVGRGRISDSGSVSGAVQLVGQASNATPSARGQAIGFGGIDITGQATFGGALQALAVTGNLSTRVARGNVSGIAINQGVSTLQFAGNVGSSGSQMRGTSVTSVGQVVQTDGPVAKRINLTNVRASGPFVFSVGNSGNIRPFWTDSLQVVRARSRVRLDSDLSVSAARFVSADTQVTGFTARLPISASLDDDKAWSAAGRIAGRATGLGFGGARLVGVDVTGPFTARAVGGGWQATSDLNLKAASLSTGDTRLNGLTATAPISLVSSNNGGLSVASSRCLAFSARGGTFPGEASVGAVTGRLCPDSTGQLAVLGGPRQRLVATPQFDPLAVQIGGATGDQRIELGEINGNLAFKPGGGIALNLLATQFAFSLKLPDGTTALIKANEAALDVVPRAGNISLKGRIGRVSSLGLPVLISGGADADLVAGPRGLSGTFGFEDILVKDVEKSPRFGEFRLIGSGNLSGNRITIAGDVQEPASKIKMATLVLDHNIASGAGRLAVDANDLLFSPQPYQGRVGLDIATLVPPLRGVATDMFGVVNGTADVAWERGQPIISGARIETKGLDFGILLGPVTNLVGEVALEDLLAVRTDGVQTIKIKSLNASGIPIDDGTIQFALPGDSTLRLENASWPFAEGRLSVRPATWAFRDGDQSFAIDVEDVDLAKLLRLTDVPNLEIDGKVSGVFPIEVRDGNVEIVGGRLRAREGGGVIRYTGPNASPPPPPLGFFGRVRQRLFGKPAPAGADLAVEALRALEYKILEITVDGRLSGELLMGVILEGSNQQVLSGQPFKFNIKLNVPVGQLLENVNRLNNMGSSPEVLLEMDRVLREEAAEKARKASAVPAAPTPPTPPSPPTP